MNVLSRQRSAIMGVSILLIMLFHCCIHCDNPLMSLLFRNGDIGVESFALLSAIGINKSLRKDGNTWHFYKKRLTRIVPTYLIVVIPFALFQHFRRGASWGHVISLTTSMSTFFGDIAFWFITYILVCYLISPLIFKIKQKVLKPFALTIISIIISIGMFLLLREYIDNCAIWILRFPVFFLGFDIADYALEPSEKGRTGSTRLKTLLSIPALILIFFILILTRSISSSIAIYLIYLLVSIPLGVGIGTLMEICGRISYPFVFLGTITLELYLLHERICLPIVSNLVSNDWAAALLSITLAIIVAKSLSFIVSHIIICKMAVFHKKHTHEK